MKFSCSACGTSLKVRDELAGKAVKCPKCAARNTVPASEEVPQEVEETREEVADNPLAALAAMTGGGAAPRNEAPVERPQARVRAAAAPMSAPVAAPVPREEEMPPEPMPSMADALRGASAGGAAGRGVGAIGYRSGEAGPPDAPKYQIVRIVGIIQQVVGCIIMGVGVLWLLFGIVMAVNSLITTKQMVFAVAAMTGNGVIAAYVILMGVFCVGAGQLLFCVRDMARNSFYLKRLG